MSSNLKLQKRLYKCRNISCRMVSVAGKNGEKGDRGVDGLKGEKGSSGALNFKYFISVSDVFFKHNVDESHLN